jgi:N-acetylmuramoyl-L-alanine amidase
MTTPGKLKVEADGRVTGPANIQYNSPFPCVNGDYGSGAMMGVVMHTMVGDLPAVVSWFNNPQAQASAHFGIAQDGEIWQFGPIGQGWCAWAQEAGNSTWYSIEHADHGNPDNPLTDAQIAASAQLLECLSRFAGFPLQESNSPSEKGYGVHYMGGAAWGGHSCPDAPPKHVRSKQRPVIIALAKQIRAGGTVADYTSDGSKNLHEIAAGGHAGSSTVLRLTADKEYPADVAEWLDAVFDGRRAATLPVPKGCRLRVPVA